MRSVVTERYGDVLRIRFASLGSRAFGMDVSTYVVRGVMIDSAFPRARRQLMSVVGELRIRGCIVTHWHEDHAGNVALLAERGVPIAMRPETHAKLRERPPILFYRVATWGRPPALEVPVTSFATDPLECIHTPGHSPDHQVVWDPETGTVFSGDLWLGVRARVMHPSEDPFQVLESLRVVAALEPRRMFDAHRGLVEPAAVGLRRRIDWLAETIGLVQQRVGQGWPDNEIVKRELGGESWTAKLSQGEYTIANFVRVIRRATDNGGTAGI